MTFNFFNEKLMGNIREKLCNVFLSIFVQFAFSMAFDVAPLQCFLDFFPFPLYFM